MNTDGFEQQQQHQATEEAADSIDRLRAMIQRERRYCAKTTPASLSPQQINLRTKMVAWCYQVVDVYKFSREAVQVALCYFDSYLSTEAGQTTALQDQASFQLAAMTCFYSAVKVQETGWITSKAISTLSHGRFTVEQVEAMERRILEGLEWNMHPVTPAAFVHEYMLVLADDMCDQETARITFETAKFLTELAVMDYSLSFVPASAVAYSALLNALCSVAKDTIASDTVVFLSDVTKMHRHGEATVASVREKLCATFIDNESPEVMASSSPTSSTESCDSEKKSTTGKRSSNEEFSSKRQQQRRTSFHSSPRSAAGR